MLEQKLHKDYSAVIKAIIEHLEKNEWDGMKPWTIERLVKERPPLYKALYEDYMWNEAYEIDTTK